MDDLLFLVGNDPQAITTLAVQLEACMLMDEAAQARYAAIYGRPWMPLADLDADSVIYTAELVNRQERQADASETSTVTL